MVILLFVRVRLIVLYILVFGIDDVGFQKDSF